MSNYTPEQREAIMAEAREHIAAAKDFTPREADLLSDMGSVVAFPQRPAEPEPELVTRSFAESEVERVVGLIAQETASQLDQHREYIFEVLTGIIVELNRRQTDAVGALRTELTTARTDVARLAAQVASLTAELSRRTAAEFDKSRGGGLVVLKH